MDHQNINYIIVQAGGKGSRMQSLTRNKPKALVPVDNLPMLFRLFKKYPKAHFIVIGDYKYDVLEKYLTAFSEADYEMVCATGSTGTCAGLSDALSLIPEKAPFLLIWCDLVLPEDYSLPSEKGNYVGISKDFKCRWSYKDGAFSETPSSENGVAGFFIFESKKLIEDVPKNGEFVRWLSESTISFREEPLCHTREYGMKSEWDKLPQHRCRPFNSMEFKDDRVIKTFLDSQGETLAKREIAWYQAVDRVADENIKTPVVYSYSPLTMERITGKNIYEYSDIPKDEKKVILEKIVKSIKKLHEIGEVPSDRDSFMEAYIGKTVSRLEKVKKLVPFAEDAYITINGRRCRNVFFHMDELKTQVERFFPDKFVFLHGDCTFSNILLKNDQEPVMIDPRGYFGNTELYGDAAYDWVKLYYSLYSNYDQFNLKRFSLDIKPDNVNLLIRSNHWEDMEDEFFEMVGEEINRKQMKMYLSIIWLSLTTYVWEDYDSICGAFYQGILYFEEAMLMSEEGTGDQYFGDTLRILSDSLGRLDMNRFEDLIEDVQTTLHTGHKVIASGLGKNVPVCEKFVGTMLSLGMDANFLHTNSAVHGDMGMIRKGDLVIILTKSGNTSESVYLSRLLKERGTNQWCLTFESKSGIEELIGEEHCLTIPLEHEGDPWNIVPNYSTTLNLIVLQGIAMSLASREHLDLERDFKPNHPGGAIGEKLTHVG